MKLFMEILRTVWDWTRIVFKKICQMWSMMRLLLRPGKSWSSRIMLLLWVASVIAFCSYFVSATFMPAIQLVESVSHKCQDDLSAITTISESTIKDLDQSSDTIAASDAMKYLMEHVQGYKPYKKPLVCIADSTGKVLMSDLKNLEQIPIENNIDTFLNVTDQATEQELEVFGSGIVTIVRSGVNVDGTDYMVESSPVWGGKWRVGVLHDRKRMWNEVFELVQMTLKHAGMCVLLIFITFLTMFVMMRHALLRQQGMEGEMDVAANIQQQMLPNTFPEHDRFDMYAYLRPAKTMGGDLYDYIIRDNKLFFIIGDVSGKGMPAALLMSQVHSLFRNVARHTIKPESIVSAINVGVADGNDSNMFCTMFVGVLELDTLMLNYCNAGHNPPVLLQKGEKPQLVDVLPNLAVGLFEEFPYQPQQLQMTGEQSLFVYTDGVTEAEDALARLLGDDQLLDILADCASGTSRQVIEHVLDRVEHHARFADQSDDITMLCVAPRS